jgi:hypothetical protein
MLMRHNYTFIRYLINYHSISLSYSVHSNYDNRNDNLDDLASPSQHIFSHVNILLYDTTLHQTILYNTVPLSM